MPGAPAGGKQQPGQGGVLEAIRAIYPQIAAMKVMPDAGPHMQFIDAIEKVFVGYLQQAQAKEHQQALQQTQGLAQGQVNGQSTMGVPPQGGAGGMPGAGGAPQQIQPGGGAGMSGFGGSAQMGQNPDELSRMLNRS